MTTYKAMVRDIETKKVTEITSDYPNMKAFRDDIRGNGYEIVGRKIAEISKYNSREFWADKPAQISIDREAIARMYKRHGLKNTRPEQVTKLPPPRQQHGTGKPLGARKWKCT